VNAVVRSSIPPAEIDPDVKLSLPAADVADPEISIVIPSLNEELTMADFVDWCLEGLKKADVRGEILIIDSGSDRAGDIALEHGARVLKTPKRGLGRAYQDALPYIRGKFILMGDCDCTYDFRELAPFVKEFRAGAEFVMGSRFRGYIEPGAMPPLHRYFGTPGTTWILNTIFSSHFSDIHCGMRGISKAAFVRMDLQSQSWQYASEMVLKSVHMQLRTAEVPIRFLKDREGRLSHHKRSGWFSPWQAAWINLQAMFVYGADFFLFKPGLFLLALGSCLTFPLAFGPITLGPITFSTYWMLLGVSLALLGMQCVYMGVLAKVFFDYSGETKAKWFRRFSYTRAVSLSALMFTLGLAFAVSLALTYFKNHFSFPGTTNNLGIVGLLLMIEGFMTFTFTLILHSTAVAVRRR
jgi:glycosyltransferase involved in cell wall biosynthesis